MIRWTFITVLVLLTSSLIAAQDASRLAAVAARYAIAITPDMAALIQGPRSEGALDRFVHREQNGQRRTTRFVRVVEVAIGPCEPVAPHRRVDLGQRRVGPLLGLRHQRGLDLRHLGAVRGLHPRARDTRLARLAVGVALDHRLQRGPFQLHDREHVLQRSARVLRPELSRRHLVPPRAGRH